MINLFDHRNFPIYHHTENQSLKNELLEPSKRISDVVRDRISQIQEPQNFDHLQNRNMDLINYENIFRKNLETYSSYTEDLERKCKNKATLMKVLFISFLVLGIICATSFFLLPVIGKIAMALGLSVATVTAAWQAVFIGGGLMAGLSFLPRKFFKEFEEEKQQYHQKANILRQLTYEGNFRNFLRGELNRGYGRPEQIVAAADFAELYYILHHLNFKKEDFRRFEKELSDVKHLINPERNLLGEERKKQRELEGKVHEVELKLDEMSHEIQELENEANNLRNKLIWLSNSC